MRSDRYHGIVVEDYDKNRMNADRWKTENAIVQGFLNQVSPKKLLDAPVGTGRFVSIHAENGYDWCGIDISDGMLSKASAKIETSGAHASIVRGDLLRLPYESNAFDVVLCLRFLNLVPKSHAIMAIQEMSRVSSGWVLLGARVYPKSWFMKASSYVRVKINRHKWMPLPRSAISSQIEIIEAKYVDRRCGSDYWIFLARPFQTTETV